MTLLLDYVRRIWLSLTYQKVIVLGTLIFFLSLLCGFVFPQSVIILQNGLLWFIFLMIIMCGHKITHLIVSRDKANRQLNQTNYEQLAALIQMQSLVKPRLPLPPMRQGAASPDLLLALYGEIVRKKPSLILECGSGVSTIWIGYILEQIGYGKLISVEHDPIWAQRVNQWAVNHNLDQTIQVIESELTEVFVNDKTMTWYDMEKIRSQLSQPIDFLVIDGPIGVSNSEARYPAVPLLKKHLSDSCVIVLDDTHRSGEKMAASTWAADLGYTHEFYNFEKGAAILSPPIR